MKPGDRVALYGIPSMRGTVEEIGYDWVAVHLDHHQKRQVTKRPESNWILVDNG